MASFNSLKMAAKVAADSRVSVSKGFLGLSTKAVYLSTSSKLKCIRKEYTKEVGEKLRMIFGLNSAELQKYGDHEQFSEAQIGNYMLEASISVDHQFAAFRLYRYEQLDYTPVTDVVFYEGNDAEIISKMI